MAGTIFQGSASFEDGLSFSPWGDGRGFLCFEYNKSMEQNRSLAPMLKILHQQIPVLAERYSVETLEVFGSYVRDEQRQDSDLDVLVTFKEDPSLLTYIAIENYLSDLLGVKVDLVMKDSLKPKIGEQILSEAIPV